MKKYVWVSMGLLSVVLLSLPSYAGPALDKAQMSKTLNCGFVSYDPALIKDSKTGTWTGFDAELIKAAAGRLHIETEFKTETNWGQVFEDLKFHKFDMLCASSWVNAEKAKFALYSNPLYYQPVFLIARADDKRFDDHPERANDPSIKFVVLEGDAPVSIIQSDFPKAQVMTLPQIQSYSDTFLSVATGKADLLIGEASGLGIFNKNNPGKLKIVNVTQPLRIYPTAFVFGTDEIQLWHAFNAAINEMTYDGTLEKIMKKYVAYPHAYYPVGRDGRFVVMHKAVK